MIVKSTRTEITRMQIPDPLSFVLGILLVTGFHFVSVEAQFPSVCARNATSDNATCCPIPPGFIEPCGGKDRGHCRPIPRTNQPFNLPRYADLKEFQNDDRIDWPFKYFSSACECEGNYMGYMCQECKWGWHGRYCDNRKIVTRKNIYRWTIDEVKRFKDALNVLKKTPSEYVIPEWVHPNYSDPFRNNSWIQVTKYEAIIFSHIVAGRTTHFAQSNRCHDTYLMDFAHSGSGFPTWHRLFVLTLERAIQKELQDEDFALPVWHWVGANNCDICTNDYMGAINYSDPYGRLDAGSDFYDWKQLCFSHTSDNSNLGMTGMCAYCGPTIETEPIRRQPPHDWALPTVDQFDYLMSRPFYDRYPFDSETSKEDPLNDRKSWRNTFEGNVMNTNIPPHNSEYPWWFHNWGHVYFNGTMSQSATSVNDPLFFLYHAGVDQVFEMWIRKYMPNIQEFPATNAPLGHNRNDYMAGFFPPASHGIFFADSRTLGYDYDITDIDEFLEEGPGPIKASPKTTFSSTTATQTTSQQTTVTTKDTKEEGELIAFQLHPAWIVAIVLGAVIAMLVVFALSVLCWKIGKSSKAAHGKSSNRDTYKGRDNEAFN